MFRKVLCLAFVLAATAMVGDMAMAQRGGPGGGGPGGGPGGFGGFGRGGGNAAMLLGNDQVREQLELSDDQIERIEELQAEMRENMQSMFQGMRDMSREEQREAFADIRTKMEKANADMEKELDDILLDHQREKLVAMQAKTATRFGGVAGILNDANLMKRLGLSQREVDKLKEKAEALQEEQNEAIAEVRKKYDEKMIAMLPEEIQDTVKQWMETEVPEFGGRGGQRGRGQQPQRGGRGGNAPSTRPSDF